MRQKSSSEGEHRIEAEDSSFIAFVHDVLRPMVLNTRADSLAGPYLRWARGVTVSKPLRPSENYNSLLSRPPLFRHVKYHTKQYKGIIEFTVKSRYILFIKTIITSYSSKHII